MAKNTEQQLNEIAKSIRNLNKSICSISDFIDDSSIEEILQTISDSLKKQDELIKIDYCDNDAYSGSIIKVWDEETNVFGPDIYTDATGAVVATPPTGSICSPKVDYEYKFFETEKCLADGSKVKEVLCITYEDATEASTSTFWIVNGAKVEIEPTGITECVDCAEKGSQGTISDWSVLK